MEISEEKLKRMLERIIELEKEYIRANSSNEKYNNEIKNKIKKIIEEEAECY